MAKKLGKRARKFAKKKLQTVEKTRRIKQKPFFKRKSPAVTKALDSHVSDPNSNPELDQDNVGSLIENNLENLFLENEEEEYDEYSESDGYLSEDTECPYISESENESSSKDDSAPAAFKEENIKISLDIEKQKQKLQKIIEKDPEFAKFLETKQSDLDHYNKMGSESESESDSEPDSPTKTTRPVTQTTAELWCWLATEDSNTPALTNLLNTFYSLTLNSHQTPNPQTVSTVLQFTLLESDAILRERLGIKEDCATERVIAKAKNCKLVKLYLKGCVGVLNQVTDSGLVCFVLERIRVSVDFFGAFTSLGKRLIKVLVNFWASGDESLSKSSFLLLKDICSKLPSEYFNICMKAMYKSFILRSKFVEDSNLKHVEFLMKSLLEIFASDPLKSYPVATSSLRQLANMIKSAIKSNKEEDLTKIENFQFMNCLNIWVQFISLNYKQKNNLDQLFSLSIKIILGLAQLFTGPRFLPLRVKCVKMLNDLSLSSGIFIPVSPLVFDCFEFGERKEKGDDTRVNLASLLKVPKNIQRSKKYQEECIKAGVHLLCSHLSQWSYHISFPELCTKPLVLLKIIHKNATAESFKRQIERLINQIEANRNYIQTQRDQVSFSPNDQTSIENFLLVEKSTTRTSFSQFYASILQHS